VISTQPKTPAPARVQPKAAETAAPPPTAAGNQGLTASLEAWRKRLEGAGIPCRAVALHGDDASVCQEFPKHDARWGSTWLQLRQRVTPADPVALGRIDSAGGNADLMLATALQLPDGRAGIVGAVLAPPHHERTIQLVLLSLGWLQLSVSAASLMHNQHAARLLELMGHVGSQHEARAAAQEWINRTAAWARAEAPAEQQGLGLMLFEVRHGVPHWWVAADTAWSEKGSPAVREAGEMATRAVVESQEVVRQPWWALPILDDGEPVAVLVARSEGAPLPGAVLTVLRGSANLSEPLLRRWRQADRSLLAHTADATRNAWRKLSGPGHATWKVAALGVVVLLGVLLAWPQPDRVTANLAIEGRVRQIVTAPFDGFVGQALVRPGDRVTLGQPLARLDDRDLKLEQAKIRSERDQAAGKMRQAMSERDSSAVAVASAELQQAEAQLALVEAKLERAQLLSPLEGIVVSGDWVQQIGGPVETGKQMFEIAASDGYRVVLHVPDRDIARVHVGQGGTLRLTGQPQASHAFKVSTVTATASVQDGTNGFRVEAVWDGAAPALSPGMQGVGKVEVGQANLLTLWTRSSIDWLRLKLWSWWW
jgi:multidrug resistance efflux pump